MDTPTTNPAGKVSKPSTFSEILPKSGLLYHDEPFELVLCKPKILLMKSVTLEKLENMQKQAQEALILQEKPAEPADQ